MTNQLTLAWTEAGVRQTQTIQNGQPSKNPGTVRLGRDPAKCDIVFSHPSVSGLHVEIFFNRELQEYAVRNLRESNPPLVDGKILARGEAKLNSGSHIHLGQVQIEVVNATQVQVADGAFKIWFAVSQMQPNFALRAVEWGVSVVRYFFGGGGECDALSVNVWKRGNRPIR
jgi:hypothetical protein